MHKRVRVLYTHDFTRGWTLGSHSGLLSVAVADSSGKGVFPFLGDSASKCVEAILFFLPLARGDQISSSSSSSLEEERALESSDIMSEVPWRRSLPLVSLASFSAFFSGAL